MNNIWIIVCLAVVAVLVIILILKVMSLEKKVSSDDVADDLSRMRMETSQSFRNMSDMISRDIKDSYDRQDKRLADLNTRFSNMAVENEQKLDNIRNTMETKISNLTEENNAQLEKMRDTVDEKLQKTLEERIGQSFRTVNESLEQVTKGLGEMQSLANGVGDLKKVLSNVKTRGVLGEVQLEAILDEILSPEQYEKNVNTTGEKGNYVEFAVKLPGDGDGSIWLPIDSKFPGDAYANLLDAYDTGDKAAVENAQKALVNVVKSEARDISEKYIAPPKTTNFGVMFLPVEGLYAEVVKLGMVEMLQRDYRVNIAGPTTMAAMLNSLQMGFRTLAIQKRSNEVWEVLGAVKTEFNRFEAELSKAQKNIDQANDSLDKLIGTRTRMMRSKLKKVEELPGDQAEVLLGFDSDEFSGDY